MYGLQYASWGKVLFYNLKDMEKRWVINPPLQNVDKVLGKTPRIFLCDEAESQYLRDF